MIADEKPTRLYFKSYMQLIRNSVGSNMFRNFYVKTDSQGEFDAFGDGDNSCAFYVSSVLVIFGKIGHVHGLISSVVEDLKKSGWREVSELQSGDVVVWEAQEFADGPHGHIGFYLGDNRAISTSVRAKTPVEHDVNFGEAKRKITQVFRFDNWEEETSASGVAR